MRGASFFLLSTLCLSTGWARSVQKLHKRYDLDGNGIPDLCGEDGKGNVDCLQADGSWTVSYLTNQTADQPLTTHQAFPVPLSSSPTSVAPIATTTKTRVRPVPQPKTSPPARASTTSVATAQLASGSAAPAPAPSPSHPSIPKTFPSIDEWKSGNGTTWTLQSQGQIQYTQTLQTQHLQGDKCRTGSIGNTTIWNCGDMQCPGSVQVCGFSMGPAFYATVQPSIINTDNLTLVNDATFAEPWAADPVPVAPQTGWGMDTSNVAEVNETHGVAYVWVIWRGASDGSYVDQGLAAVSVTLGKERPVAKRVGTYLSTSDGMAMGLLGIMADGGYIYSYAVGGPSGLVVARVLAGDAVFDGAAHEFFEYESQTWTTPGGIPNRTDMTYGIKTEDPMGKFGCAVYGSVFWSDAWGKYVILCNIYMMYTNMYVADRPEGPWSETYPVLEQEGYGSHAHPEFGTGELWFSQGPLGTFDLFKMTVDV